MITILTYEQYAQWTPLPQTNNGTLEQQSQIEKRIEDATNQIDNLCGGKVFKDYPNLDENIPSDATRIYKLQRAINDYVLLIDQTGKMWNNSSQSGGGSAPFSINTTSTNSQIEYQRQDIIKSLIQGDWYKNTRIENVDLDGFSEASDFDEIVKKLSIYFLRTDGTNNYEDSTLTFPNTTSMNGTGDIIGSKVQNPFTGKMVNPMLKNYDVVLGDEVKAKYIFDPIDNIYKLINAFDVNYFGGLTQEEIYTAIAQSGSAFNLDFVYRKGYIVQFIDTGNFLKWAESLQDDNQGNEPTTSPLFWNVLDSVPIDVELIVEQLKPYIEIEVAKQIDELPTIEVYDKDEVDLNFLSKTINNTTQTIAGIIKFLRGMDLNDLEITSLGDGLADTDAVNLRQLKGYLNRDTFNLQLVNGPVKFFGGIDVVNEKITGVADGVQDTDATNLRQLKTKQNTLIAGTNITIDEDTINATGGGQEWVELLSPNQTADNIITTQLQYTLPEEVRTYEEFRVLGVGIDGKLGQFTIHLVNATNSYGQATNNTYYLSGSSNVKTLKWVNVSGSGASGVIWLYCDFAIRKIYGKKR